MTRAERACQIWAVLAYAASKRQSLTYGELGKLIGVPAAGLGALLDPIHSYCLNNNLPPLTVLVVQRETGLPGSGFTSTTLDSFGQALSQVFAFDWLGHGNPQPEKLI